MKKTNSNRADSSNLGCWIIGGVITIAVLWAGTGLGIYWLLPDATEHGTFGDMFGAINSLFSGLAFLGVIVAILLQKEELRLQREELEQTRAELRRSADAHEQTTKTMHTTAYLTAISATLNSYTELADREQHENFQPDTMALAETRAEMNHLLRGLRSSQQETTFERSRTEKSALELCDLAARLRATVESYREQSAWAAARIAIGAAYEKMQPILDNMVSYNEWDHSDLCHTTKACVADLLNVGSKSFERRDNLGQFIPFEPPGDHWQDVLNSLIALDSAIRVNLTKAVEPVPAPPEAGPTNT